MICNFQIHAKALSLKYFSLINLKFILHFLSSQSMCQTLLRFDPLRVHPSFSRSITSSYMQCKWSFINNILLLTSRLFSPPM